MSLSGITLSSQRVRGLDCPGIELFPIRALASRTGQRRLSQLSELPWTDSEERNFIFDWRWIGGMSANSEVLGGMPGTMCIWIACEQGKGGRRTIDQNVRKVRSLQRKESETKRTTVKENDKLRDTERCRRIQPFAIINNRFIFWECLIFYFENLGSLIPCEFLPFTQQQ
jgi:hypothetical protein